MSNQWLNISVKDNAAEVLRGLDLLARSAEIATQRAMTKTALKVRDAEKREMSSVFDSPTPWTLNSLRIRNVGKLNIIVDTKDDRTESYLSTQTFGANPRREKAFEVMLRKTGILPDGWRAVPGERAAIDQYGNQSPGEIRQILSWFKSAEVVLGSTQNLSDKRRASLKKGTKKRRGFEYVLIRQGGRKSKGLLPGIYRKTIFGAFGKSIEPIIIFVPTVAYRTRFDFFGVAQRAVDKEFPKEMDEAVKIEIERGRAR